MKKRIVPQVGYLQELIL